MATTPKTVKKATPSSAAKPPATEKSVAKKPVAAKAAAPKKATAAAPKKAAASAPKKPAAAKKPATKSPAAKGATKSGITPEQRYRMVAEAAYYHAERQGFTGDPVKNWTLAEAEIAALLSKK